MRNKWLQKFRREIHKELKNYGDEAYLFLIERFIATAIEESIGASNQKILPKLYELEANIPLTPDTGARRQVRGIIEQLKNHKEVKNEKI